MEKLNFSQCSVTVLFFYYNNTLLELVRMMLPAHKILFPGVGTLVWPLEFCLWLHFGPALTMVMY